MNIENLEHIKKYKEVLTLYKNVMEDMSEYFKNNKKLSGKMLEEMQDLASKKTLFDHDLNFDDAVKNDVLMDALFFRNYKKFTSLVDIFLKENKINEEETDNQDSNKKLAEELLSNKYNISSLEAIIDEPKELDDRILFYNSESIDNADSYAESFEEGVDSGIKDVILNMLRMNYDVNEIAKL